MYHKSVIFCLEDYQAQLKLYGYNQVLKVGNTIKISGQGGRDDEKSVDFKYMPREEEIEKAFKNVDHVINRAYIPYMLGFYNVLFDLFELSCFV